MAARGGSGSFAGSGPTSYPGDLGAFDSESLRQTLTGMTGGMAIALNVTVAGIATALLLKFQYFLLDSAIGELFHEVADISEVHVLPTLRPAANVS